MAQKVELYLENCEDEFKPSERNHQSIHACKQGFQHLGSQKCCLQISSHYVLGSNCASSHQGKRTGRGLLPAVLQAENGIVLWVLEFLWKH